MWIADIIDECILGLDFLQHHPCLVNLKESSLRVGAQEFPLRKASLKSERRIRRGTAVAKCERVNCVSIPEAAPSSTDEAPGTVRRASFNEIPHHLEPLLLQSTEGLSVEKKETVCQLLCEFSNLFSTGPRDLGCTGLAKH